MVDPYAGSVAPPLDEPASSAPTATIWAGVATRGAATVGARAAGFAASVLIARLLPTAEAGRFFFFLSLASFIGLLSGLGTAEAATRFVTSADAQGRTADSAAAVRTTLKLGLTIAGGMLGGALIWLIADTRDWVVPAALAAGAGLMLQTPSANLLRIRRRFIFAEMVLAAVPFAFLLLIAVGDAVGGLKGVTAAWMRIAIELGAGTLLVITTARAFRRSAAGVQIRRLLTLSLPLWLSGMSWLALQQSDVVMLGTLAGADEVGVYAPVLKFAEIGGLIFGILIPYVFPAAARAYARGRPDEIQDLARSATKVTVIISLPVLLPLILAPEFVIESIFGVEAEYVSIVGRILGIAYLVNSILGINSVMIEAVGAPRALAVRSLVAIVVAVGLNAILIPRFGAIGAATATLIAYTTLHLVNAAYLYQVVRVTPLDRELLVTLVAAGSGIGAALVLGVAAAGLLALVVSVVVVWSVTGWVAWRTTDPRRRAAVISWVVSYMRRARA